MTKKSIITAGAGLLFIGSFFLTWVDYRVQRDLTGLDFLSQYSYLIAGFLLVGLVLALLGEYAVISGLFVLLFLAELFYGSAKTLRFLAPGFYLALAMTALMGFLVLTIKDNTRRNFILKLRRKYLPKSQTGGDEDIEI